MLEQSVCRKCVAERSGEPVQDEDGSWTEWAEWYSSDDRRWSNGVIICRIGKRGDPRWGVTDPPPDWCPHAFEHAVVAGMS